MTIPGGHHILSSAIVEVPRLPESDDPPAALSRQRMLPSVAMAHARGGPLAVAWVRPRANGRVIVMAGSSSLPPPPDSETGPVAFPPGARGRAMAQNRASDALSAIPHWQRAELALDAAADPREAGPLLEDLFAQLPDRTMGVFFLARPKLRADIEDHFSLLSDAIDELESRRSGRGEERLKLKLAESEHAYLETWAPQGLWDLEVWTGGQTPELAQAVAAVLGASGDLADTPLRVRPASSGAPTSGMAWSSSRLVGADCVASVLRPPLRELPGVRIADPPAFDLNPEVTGDLVLGRVLDVTLAPSLVLGLPADSINRHVFVTGATGSGKSQTVRSLLESLTASGIPWLAIEPAKAEYAAMAGRLARHGKEVVVIRPGDPAVAPPSLNPLEPSSVTVDSVTHQFPLQTHLDMVRALFTASFDAQEPFPQILASALTRCYERLGWNLAVGAPLTGDRSIAPRWPTMGDLQAEAMTTVDAIGYGKEIADNVRGFVKVRIDSLRLGTPGRFFEGGHPLDLEGLLDANVVFEIEDLGDDNDKAFFIGTILIRVFEVLRLREALGVTPKGLAHVTVIEEAHRLLRHVEEGSAAAQAVTMFANLLAEVRAYGEGIVVAEQIPSKVISDVVKNSAVKVVHRLPAEEDRDLVGGTMNLSAEQSRHVVSLPPGRAVVHVDGMDLPVLVAIDGSGAAREGRPATRTPAPISVRSRSCPSNCASTACTLEQLVVSQTLEEHDRLELWGELVVLAHLLGEPVSTPSAHFSQRLAEIAPDRLRCAIGLAVDAAVDRRSAFIRLHYEPDRLKRRAAVTMATQLKDPGDPVVPDPRFQFVHFRWADVARILNRPGPADDTSTRHPETAAWADRELVLHGSTWAEQLDEVKAAGRRLQVPAIAALGGTPMVVGQLADRLGSGPTRVDRFKAAAGDIGFGQTWPAHWLAPCLGGDRV